MEWKAEPNHPADAVVEVRGLPPALLDALRQSAPGGADWVTLLCVKMREADGGYPKADSPPMLGTYSLESNVLKFRPKYQLDAGVRYVALLDLYRPGKLPVCGLAGPWPVDYEIPEAAAEKTVVKKIYPTADVLPENLLKFYVYFSAPMSRGGIYQHIRLINEAGQPIELPFLELEQELWNPAMTRLTLFIDPGRIKRGVRPLEEIGPSLESGKSFTLEILPAARDAAGNPLAEGMQKRFKVSPADRSPPDPADWTIMPPKPGTRDPLSIDFGKSMDHALAERMIQVENARGAMAGIIDLSKAETVWRFTPAEPWGAGNYELVVQKKIEDLAGNNIGKPFEVDAENGDAPPPDISPARIPVSIK